LHAKRPNSKLTEVSDDALVKVLSVEVFDAKREAQLISGLTIVINETYAILDRYPFDSAIGKNSSSTFRMRLWLLVV